MKLQHPFSAIVVDQQVDGTQTPLSVVELLAADALPAPGGKVLVRVAYSSLNYKDGLAVTGTLSILRQFPIVPGIDLAGTVEDPGGDPRFKAGDTVVLTGWGIGERVSGGYAGYARVNGDWLIPLPAKLDPLHAMAIGTAGFTAMLCVLGLEDHGIIPTKDENTEIVVSGAAGGVGSMAIALLAKLGCRVVACTGRAKEEGNYLRDLGAAEVLPRESLSATSGKPLESERWAGAVDCVGGETLASILRQTKAHGSVAACGLAGGANLSITVLPFILRGINLLGIDSVMCPRPLRERAWQRLATDLDLSKLDKMTQVFPLREVPKLATEILAGKIRGRVVIDVNA